MTGLMDEIIEWLRIPRPRLSWRRRVLNAEARGSFTDGDKWAWSHVWTCPAGEAADRYGLPMHDHVEGSPDHFDTNRDCRFGDDCLWKLADEMSDAINRNDFGLAHQILDQVDDAAFQMALKKRV